MSIPIDANPFAICRHFAGSRIHLGVSGSVACYKAMDLLRAWLKIGLDVSATPTAGACQFIGPLLLASLGAKPVYGEMFAHGEDVFAHLEPGMHAQALVVAPASANLIARMAHGVASDMLSSQVVAFDGPIVIAPAMNPRMWANSATRENVDILQRRGAILVAPGKGDTACGETGQGRLAELPEIFLAVLKALSPADMLGKNVLVTLGPTREYWDGVRFWSNPSSGRMGCALATCAWLRGANVTAICGPGVQAYLPRGIKRISVESARDMYCEAEKAWPITNFGIFTAAVADFSPIRPPENSIKHHKKDFPTGLEISFENNVDIIATLCAQKTNGQKALGFAAEITPDMQSLLPLAREKLKNKNADIIAGNRVNPGIGAFGAEMDSMAVVDADGQEKIIEEASKADIAWELCTWLLKIATP